MYSSGLWLTTDVQKEMFKQLRLVERSYNKMASIALQINLPRYRLVPKFHAIGHLRKQVGDCIDDNVRSMNALADACDQDEDYVGRVSRLSRRVSIRLTMIRTITRVLVASKLKLTEVRKRILKHCKGTL